MIYRRGSRWRVRWRERVGERVIRRERVLEARTRAAAELEARRLEPIRPPRSLPFDPAITLTRYIQEIYLPWAGETLAPSTVKGYRDIWKVHEWETGKRALRELGTWEAQVWLQEEARQRSLTTLTLRHIKAFYSGVFTHARMMGVVAGNPFQGTRLPRGRPSEDTIAYPATVIQLMREVLPEPARTLLTVAAYTGLRRSELAGLRWRDIDWEQGMIWVRQSRWRGKEMNTKTPSSRGGVPAVPELLATLQAYREATDASGVNLTPGTSILGEADNWIFPFDLGNLTERVIRPTLRAIGIEWKGWHACRRGLATTLHAAGVSELTIQKVLRHANVRTTQAHYIKTSPEAVREALETNLCGDI